MTNNDVIEKMNILHDAMDEIKELSWCEGVKIKHLRTYLTLIEQYYDLIHEHIDTELHKKGGSNA